MRHAHHVVVSLLFVSFGWFAGCAYAPLDNASDLDSANDPDDATDLYGGDPLSEGEPEALDWMNVAPGVWRAEDGEQTVWSVSGAEGHAWLAEHASSRLNAGERGEESPYEELLAISEEVMESGALVVSPEEGTEHRRGKSKTYTASISTAGTYGLSANAYARRGWGYTRAEARVVIDGMVQASTKSTADSCMASCSSTASATISRESLTCSCYAWAYANSGGSTTYAERTTCPTSCS